MGLEINPAKCTLLTKNLDLDEVKQYTKTYVLYEDAETGEKGNVYWGANVHPDVRNAVKKGTRIYRLLYNRIVTDFGSVTKEKRVGEIFNENNEMIVTNNIIIK